MSILQDFTHRILKRPYVLHTAIDVGEGNKTAVLLHGIASRGQVWQQLATTLASKDYRVVAYDLLGFGASAKPSWSQYGVADHARSVLKSLNKSSVQFPVTLVGHSMGCLVAVHLASKYPERINRVILYEPPLFADIPEFSSHLRRRKVYFSVFERIVDSPTMVLTYARLFGRAAAKIAGFALSEETWLPFERSLRNTVMGQTAYQELHNVRVPTAIVYGRFDIVVTQTEVKNMFKNNAHISFYRIADTHGVSKKSSAYLAKLITEPDTIRKNGRKIETRANKRRRHESTGQH